MELSAGQRDIREAVSELTRDIVMPTARGADATETFPEDIREELAYGSLAVATALLSRHLVCRAVRRRSSTRRVAAGDGGGQAGGCVRAL